MRGATASGHFLASRSLYFSPFFLLKNLIFRNPSSSKQLCSYISRNLGQNWMSQASNLPSGAQYYSITISDDGNKIAAATINGNIWCKGEGFALSYRANLFILLLICFLIVRGKSRVVLDAITRILTPLRQFIFETFFSQIQRTVGRRGTRKRDPHRRHRITKASPQAPTGANLSRPT